MKKENFSQQHIYERFISSMKRMKIKIKKNEEHWYASETLSSVKKLPLRGLIKKEVFD